MLGEMDRSPLTRIKPLLDCATAFQKIALDCVPVAESLAAYAAVEGHEAYVYLFSRNFPSLDSKTLARTVDDLREHATQYWKRWDSCNLLHLRTCFKQAFENTACDREPFGAQCFHKGMYST